MELGGKDAAIVCTDADLAGAASHIVKGAFSYSGQRCTGARCVLYCDAHALSSVSCAGWRALWCSAGELGAADVLLPARQKLSCLRGMPMHASARPCLSTLPPTPCPSCPIVLSCPLAAAAVKLVLVEESVADELVPRVVEGAKRLTVGM